MRTTRLFSTVTCIAQVSGQPWGKPPFTVQVRTVTWQLGESQP